MDEILTEFISQTKADAALAHDVLELAGWNLQEALTLYDSLMQTDHARPNEWIGQELASEFHHLNDATSSETDSKEDIPLTLDDSFEARKKLLREKHDGCAARGLSFLAEEVVDKFHKAAVSKYRVSSEEQTVIQEQFFRHSFMYPDFSGEPADLQEFIASDLIDVSIKSNLEKNNRLNWWAHTGKFPQLEPLATSGDGNCLLHAASLYMWGFHDRFLILRSAMYRLLTQNRQKEGIFSRWRYQTQLRNNDAGGLTYSEEEWDFEWSEVVRIATNKPRNELTAASIRHGSTLRPSYEYLEEIHIFALAHVTQRPIIVISETTLKGISGEDLAPIYFGGIYLPLEINPTICHKSPVVLAYDAAHFSALVAKEEKPQQQQRAMSSKQLRNLRGIGGKKREEPFIPLVSLDGRLLPIQFVYNPLVPALDEKWGKMQYDPGDFPPELICLLESYLSIRWVELPIVAEPTAPDSTESGAAKQPKKLRCPAALLAQESQPIYQKELIEKYIENVQHRFEEEKERQQKIAQVRARWEEEARLHKTVPCEGEACDMFGTAVTNNLCSQCYQKSTNGYDEVEKVDLASERELDPDTVELYIPNISSYPPPSYNEALMDVSSDQGTQGDSEEARERREERPQTDASTSFNSSTVSSDVARKSPPETENGSYSTDNTSDVARKSPPKPPPETDNGSHSTDNIISSSFSERSGGVRSPKKLKGWAKKVQAFPSGMLLGSKSKKALSSYLRDKIKPISHAMTKSSPSFLESDGKSQCVTDACPFFGNPETHGLCLSCYKELGSPKAPSTIV